MMQKNLLIFHFTLIFLYRVKITAGFAEVKLLVTAEFEMIVGTTKMFYISSMSLAEYTSQKSSFLCTAQLIFDRMLAEVAVAEVAFLKLRNCWKVNFFALSFSIFEIFLIFLIFSIFFRFNDQDEDEDRDLLPPGLYSIFPASFLHDSILTISSKVSQRKSKALAM